MELSHEFSSAPLAGILSAGNRVMHKPSELTPSTSDLLKQMIEEYFDEAEMAVFVGDAEVGAAFRDWHLIT